jgi:hypothetical protein
MVNMEGIRRLRLPASSSLCMNPRLIKGKVWIHVESVFGGGYQELPTNDPKYEEIFRRIDSQRFVELLDWVYNRRSSKKTKCENLLSEEAL